MNPLYLKVLATLGVAATVLVSPQVFAQEGRPRVGFADRKLQENAPLAKIQAARTIQKFMNEGTRDCDEASNCSFTRNLIGSDGQLDYSYVQKKANTVLGTQSVALNSDQESSSIATQMGRLPMLCSGENGRRDPAFETPVVVAGVAVKPTNCSVDASGNASMTFRVCTAPAFGKPIRNAPNAVACSSDPASPSYLAPAGSVCASQACDSEPAGSQFGWSAEQSITYSAANTSDQANGRAMVFYPSMGSGISADYTSDSETLTVVKIVETHYNASRNEAAIGLKVALRFKRQVTKEMLKGEGPPVLNPEEKTSQWRTIATLHQSDTLATETANLGGKGAACVKNVVTGLADDGQISVCDTGYNENGVRPMAVSAQVVTDAAQCTTTTQCLSELVQTTNWTEKCTSPVNVASKECKTTTAWALYQQEDVSQRTGAQCTETRTISNHSCTIVALTPSCYLATYTPPFDASSCVPLAPCVAPSPVTYQVCSTPTVINNCSAYE